MGFCARSFVMNIFGNQRLLLYIMMALKNADRHNNVHCDET